MIYEAVVSISVDLETVNEFLKSHQMEPAEELEPYDEEENVVTFSGADGFLSTLAKLEHNDEMPDWLFDCTDADGEAWEG